MGSLAEIIWYLIKLPFIVIFYSFKLILFVILVVAYIYQPILSVWLLLCIIGYVLIKIAE